jgi:hypothetical protein
MSNPDKGKADNNRNSHIESKDLLSHDIIKVSAVRFLWSLCYTKFRKLN